MSSAHSLDRSNPLRVLTWNINGLRAILRRQNISIRELLDPLEADVICLQETKLGKAELDRDLAITDGWESFFAFCTTRGGYSGTATFCRSAATVPIAAEAGLTGTASSPVECSSGAAAGCEALRERFSAAELAELDAEGRCVITDHGAMVVFNLYGPNIADYSDPQRMGYKLRFYEAVQIRAAGFTAAGRHVVITGDLNISPQPLDHCDPDMGNFFDARPDRRWLRGLIEPGSGAFVDGFRLHHPYRKDAYTCWNTASGARVNNWGTRIDLTLLSTSGGPLSLVPLCVAADIMPQVTGSDHAPSWVDLALPADKLPTQHSPPPLSSRFTFTGKQRNLRAWLASSQGRTIPQLSSLERPASANAAAASASQPPLELTSRSRPSGDGQTEHYSHRSSSQTASQPAARQDEGIGWLPAPGSIDPASSAVVPLAKGVGKARAGALGKRASSARGSGSGGKQQASMAAFLSKRAPAPSTNGSNVVRTSQPPTLQSPPLGNSAAPSHAVASASTQRLNTTPVMSLWERSPLGYTPISNVYPPSGSIGLSLEAAVSQEGGMVEGQRSVLNHGCASRSGSAPGPSWDSNADDSIPMQSASEGGSRQLPCQNELLGEGSGACQGLMAELAAHTAERNAAAATAWQAIQRKQQLPLCPGHKEPSVIRTVKKGGDNQGRQFFVCARPDGPAPQGRCDYFKWAAHRSVRGSGSSTEGENKRK